MPVSSTGLIQKTDKVVMMIRATNQRMGLLIYNQVLKNSRISHASIPKNLHESAAESCSSKSGRGSDSSSTLMPKGRPGRIGESNSLSTESQPQNLTSNMNDISLKSRERGITMTVAVAYFNSKKYHVVVLDSPCHKDFVPNMISGATQADAAIIVIDASVGAFEAGLDSSKGQTREHAQLIRGFGVDQITAAVNKMDVVQYLKDRFD